MRTAVLMSLTLALAGASRPVVVFRAVVPPPGPGVVTVKLPLPGSTILVAGSVTVTEVEFTKVAARLVPL